MAVINHGTREVVFKIVYFGPPRGGKTTNLSYLHSRIDQRQKGELVSHEVSSDRTLSFDYSPTDVSVANGFQTRFQIYTSPGFAHYNATHQLVLRGADGLVFIADSAEGRLGENQDTFSAMFSTVTAIGASPLPLVIQYNKRDLPDASPTEALDSKLQGVRSHWTEGTTDLPKRLLAVATNGHNVFATLNAVSQQVLRRFDQAMVENAP